MRPHLCIPLLALLLAACSGSSPEIRPTAPDHAGVVPAQAAQQPAGPSPTARPPRIISPSPWAPPPAASGVSAPAINARAAIVMDEASGAVLYARDAQRPLPPASLTKIATAIVALEEGDLEATVATDVNSDAMKSSTVMGLLPGDQFKLRDLLYGLMLPSGNDAALAIGRHLAGSDSAFVEKMNALARRLGLTETSFSNAHGLSSRGHAASAHDLAVLSRYAMTVPGFAEIVRTPYWTAIGSRRLELTNLHPLTFTYPGGDGIKTGYTGRAGRTMVASANRDGHRVYVVLLNAPEMEKDAVALLDWAFASHRWLA